MSEASTDAAVWTHEQVVCNLCGPTPERLLGFRGGEAHRRGLGIRSRIVQCTNCGLIYANPMPRPTSAFASYHDTDEYFRHHVPEVKIRAFAKLVREAEGLLHATGRMLDIGCGRGESLVAATRAGWEAIGLEPTAEFATYARERFGVDVRPAELSEAAFPDGNFDLIILNAVLEHVYDPLSLLREMRRVVRTGGVIYIGVPNEAGLYWTLGNLYQRLRRRDWVLNISPTFEPYHTFGWSKTSLTAALDRAGFRIESMRTAADKNFYSLTSGGASPYERAAEIVDRVGQLLDRGSQLGLWARAV